MIVNESKVTSEVENVFHVGKLWLQKTDKYKYLGLVINSDGNLRDHISEVRGKAEAAYQTILSLCQNYLFKGIMLETIWELFQTCIQPIITYGLEAWDITQKELKEFEKVQEHLIKRILLTPIQTPTEAIYYETGLMSIKSLVQRNKVLMGERLKRNKIGIVDKVIRINGNNSWHSKYENQCEKFRIPNQPRKKSTIKYTLRKGMKRQFKEELDHTSRNKSKVKHMKNRTENYDIMRKPYLNKMNRKQASLIFKARTRMIEVKHNFRNKYVNNMDCRKCFIHEETQDHILNECPVIHYNDNLKIANGDIFKNNVKDLRITAEKIEKILKVLHQ